jgi:hypothetical protein
VRVAAQVLEATAELIESEERLPLRIDEPQPGPQDQDRRTGDHSAGTTAHPEPPTAPSPPAPNDS